MTTLTYILIFSFISSVASLAGGVLLLVKKRTVSRFYHLLGSFAAGALLATAFFDLLPEAVHENGGEGVFTWALAGFLFFFLIERFIHWFHHHQEGGNGDDHKSRPVVPLIVIGDSVHNFIDGLAVGAAFLVDPRVGVVTALAAAAHEIPQEIGDFGVLLKEGVSKARALLYNFASSLWTIVAAVAVYYNGEALEPLLPVFLAITAGFFIYIAASDLIPEIHRREKRGFAAAETLMLLVGTGLVWLAIRYLESSVH